MWGSINLATGCAMNGTEDVVMVGSLVIFKTKLDHLRNVREFV